ncbi:MAG TPA: VOC family protein [Polyangia bacterium]|nr:VOC family protein [Polyangia bacterium]
MEMETEKALRKVVKSSVAKGSRKPGEFCFFNMITPRPKEACEFFGALLGWTFTEVPGLHGYMVQVGGKNVGGLWDQHAPNTPEGTPAFIGLSVKVESADAAAAAAAKLGGKAGPAFDVMNAGRMAVITDPNGAQFDVWESKQHAGTEVDNRLPGAPSWFESRTTDVARASAFYAGLFGWKPEVVTPPGMSYTTFKRGEIYVGGMLECPPGMNVPPHWATFFNVEDVDAAARKAAELGAATCMPPTDIPGIGRFCALTSPQGVAFQLIRYVAV